MLILVTVVLNLECLGQRLIQRTQVFCIDKCSNVSFLIDCKINHFPTIPTIPTVNFTQPPDIFTVGRHLGRKKEGSLCVLNLFHYFCSRIKRMLSGYAI